MLYLILAAPSCPQGDLTRGGEPARIRSVTLDARSPPSAAMLPRLKTLGVTHITLIQFGFQSRIDVPELRMRTEADWYSESDRGIRSLARQADSLGMGVILKPHIWISRYNAEGQSRADLGFDAEPDWEAWQDQYRTLVLHYARLAEETGADMLVVGTELARAARERPEFWRGLIADVRGIYGGALTYAANWWGEYEDIAFWEDLDYIGVQAYFELCEDDAPAKAVLHKGWEPHKAAMQELSRKTRRPILFTEIGYRNVPSAAREPWRWPNRSEVGTVEPDDALQARLYEVFFESLWSEPWFAGAILWKWRADTSRRRNHLDFSPQGKLAESVIEDWFTRGTADREE